MMLKSECIRPGTPLSLEDARQLVKRFVTCYNQERMHSAIGYVTPKDKLKGREHGACHAAKQSQRLPVRAVESGSSWLKHARSSV
jgi:hypothetical protein